MPILDTDLMIGYLRKVPKAVELINRFKHDGIDLKTTILNVGELYKGAYLSMKVSENKNKIEEFLKNFNILNLTLVDIKQYAQISADLRKKGEKIGDLDELIASIVITHNEILFTRNIRHYERIPQITLQNWETSETQ